VKLNDIFNTASTDHGLELFSEQAIGYVESLLAEKTGKNGKPSIWCQVRKKLVPAKPEEIVRQFWLYRLPIIISIHFNALLWSIP
jgi:hypothetical protein